MIIVIRSLIFHFLFYAGTFLMLLAFIPCLFLKRPLFIPKVFTEYARFLLKYIVGLDLQIEGISNIPKDRSFLIVSNHQSAWETLIFFTIFKDPVMILKKELTLIPLFGWFLLRTGMITIDRKKPSHSIKNLLKEITHRLKEENRPVCIFPEGTRVKPGQPQEFKRGIYMIYKQTKADILCVVHNAGLYWEPHKLIIKPGKVKVFIYPILPPVFEEDTLKTILPGMIQSKSNELAKIGE